MGLWGKETSRDIKRHRSKACTAVDQEFRGIAFRLRLHTESGLRSKFCSDNVSAGVRQQILSVLRMCNMKNGTVYSPGYWY